MVCFSISNSHRSILSLALLFFVLTASGCGMYLGARVSSNPTANVNLASFSEEHIAEYESRVSIVVPEAYELMQVAIALTPTSQENPYRYTNPDTDYYRAMMEHFSPYQDHPLIEAMDASMQGPTSYRAIFVYRFEGDALVEDAQYGVTGLDRAFQGLLPEMEDFAQESRFHEFYAEHEAFYRDQIETYRRVVDPAHIWSWMEANFPVQHQAYRVVLSPLMQGTNNTWRFWDRERDFSEIVMFAPSPNTLVPAIEDPDYDLPRDVADILLARSVFTEIDHNYVNPVTDQHLKAIDQAMRPLSGWNDGAGSYGNPAMTFNEYYTWAIFRLYAEDRYDRAVADAAWERTEQTMARRGFPRFDAFSQELETRYAQREEGQTVADLLPEMVAWMRSAY